MPAATSHLKMSKAAKIEVGRSVEINMRITSLLLDNFKQETKLNILPHNTAMTYKLLAMHPKTYISMKLMFASCAIYTFLEKILLKPALISPTLKQTQNQS